MPLEANLSDEAHSWVFDEEVAGAFDEMLGRSVPEYGAMRALCFDVGCRYVQHRTEIVDLGCSRGEALAPFVARFGAFNRYVGVEVSPPMLAAARERYAGLIGSSVVSIRDDDLRRTYPPARASLTLCVLTLMFVPLEHRQRVVRDIWRSTLPGGALVLVEKVLGATADIDAVLVDLHHRLKAEHGYSDDEIRRKRLALEGVLVPVTAAWDEALLRQAGFAEVDCFWRHLNFCGWVAVKPVP